MKLKELITELEYLHGKGYFEECESVNDIEIGFKLMVKNTDLQDDELLDLELSKPELICSTGSFFAEYGFTILDAPQPRERKYYFDNVKPILWLMKS